MDVTSKTPFFIVDINCNGCGTELFKISDPNGSVSVNEDGTYNENALNRVVYCHKCFERIDKTMRICIDCKELKKHRSKGRCRNCYVRYKRSTLPKLNICACGCGQRCLETFLQHHRSKNKILFDLDSTAPSDRSSRSRARKIVMMIFGIEECEAKNHLCSKRLETHHIDGDPFNNERNNLLLLCQTHHKLMENRKIKTLEELKQFTPTFIISSGTRRYEGYNGRRKK